MTELGDREPMLGYVKAWIARGLLRHRDDGRTDPGGYGFIQCDDGQDAFVHYSALRLDGAPNVDPYAAPAIGARVHFTRVQSERGLRAEAVELVETPRPRETAPVELRSSSVTGT